MKKAFGSAGWALVLALSGCAGAEAQWDPLKLENLPDQKQYAEDEAVILLDEMTVTYDLDPATGEPYADVADHQRVRVLTPRGRHWASYTDAYTPDIDDLADLQARLVAPPAPAKEAPADGKAPEDVETPLGRDKALEMPAFGYVLYSDERVVRLAPDDVPVGSVFEYRAVHHQKDMRLSDAVFRFGESVPVVESRLVVSAPEGWRVDSLARQLNEDLDWKPTVKTENGRTTYEWTRRDLAAVRNEPHRPSWQLIVPTVTVRLGNWTSNGQTVENLAGPAALSAYEYGLVKGKAEPDDAIRQETAAVLQGAPDNPREKARRLYDWVRTNVRYCAIEIGMGGWVPHEAKEIHRVRYGDCKDKATLLSSMLAAAGIRSRTVSIYHHGGVPLRYGLPVLAANANHEILQVDLPDGPVFADPTSRTTPFGALPAGDQDADVLPISDPGSPLAKTPGSTADQNVLHADLDLKVEADGTAAGKFALRALGDFGDDLRGALIDRPEGQGRRHTLDGWLQLETGEVTAVDAIEALEAETPDQALVARGSVRVRPLSGIREAVHVLRLGDLSGELVFELPDASRGVPVVLGLHRRHEQTVRFALPATLEVDHLPAPVSIDSPYGRYTLTWKQDGDAVVAERSFEVRQTLVPAKDYAALRSFFESARAAEVAPVLLRAKGGKA